MAKIKSNRTSTRKDVIISKAAILFREKGYSATSMRDLAEHVGVEAASLYNHISSKAEILQEICFRVATNFMSHIEEVEQSKKTEIEKIEAILRYHIKMMVERYEEVYVSDREWKHLTDPYLSNMQGQRRAYRQRIGKIIEDGIAKGEFKKIDAPTAVLIMLHAVSGIESWHRSKRKIEGDQLENSMVEILVGGLQKP
ncbi:TetR/AcrR family transcriptional regulator [Pseudobacter ginsenosidimutans]|uniref:TetR family transcriptional regulator n=1 Tax=Pseudobacter ginsenosidimutans TaxID=661488 RepID=A0A4V2F0W6_9BACT|nr:TetR/AcrR family transcriptional regulator [Pseudobacter ginsenosidimutans]QEC41645.1 TetR/AcrR family transcriptional regulator [Pseudobacter ginsenosidimutans]RZS71561.1 TetR family transcriptional regulator [Pseudobacter ginsenosidimutans]